MNHSEAEQHVKQVVQELVAARKAAGMSIYRVAELTGLSRESVRLIEIGERSPTLHSLFLISAALGCDLGKILAAARKS